MRGHGARWAEALINYEGKDISKDITPFLLSFTYTDNASDKADDISFSLEDRQRLWLDDWFPAKGDKVGASIIVHDWDYANETDLLPCGAFEVDQITCSGPPNVVTIKAISTLVSKPMRQEKHTKAWENISLSLIAGDIASKNGLKLFWDSTEDPVFERRDQVEKSDLEFLQGLAKDYGVKVKVTDTQLVCYNGEDYEIKTPVAELSFGDKKLINWNFSSKAAGTYKAARLIYHDPVKNTKIDVTEQTEDGTEGTGRTLIINQKADTIADAKKIAKKRLEDANKKEITGSLTLMGDLRFVGGSNITISGFGSFDGQYVIEKATHSIGSAYTTKIDLSMGKESKKESRNNKKNNKKSRKKTARLVYTGNDVYHGGK